MAELKPNLNEVGIYRVIDALKVMDESGLNLSGLAALLNQHTSVMHAAIARILLAIPSLPEEYFDKGNQK